MKNTPSPAYLLALEQASGGADTFQTASLTTFVALRALGWRIKELRPCPDNDDLRRDKIVFVLHVPPEVTDKLHYIERVNNDEIPVPPMKFHSLLRDTHDLIKGFRAERAAKANNT
jgi:hypothetical protein